MTRLLYRSNLCVQGFATTVWTQVRTMGYERLVADVYRWLRRGDGGVGSQSGRHSFPEYSASADNIRAFRKHVKISPLFGKRMPLC